MIAGKSEDEVIRAFVGDPEASRLMTFAETVEERAAHLSSVEPRRVARTWDESITALDQSRWFFDRSFLSSTACNFSQTPASFQADRRRQQVTRSRSPSRGAGTPTGFRCAARTGCRTTPAGPETRGRPSTCFDPGSGSNGSISDHSSSERIHGRECLFSTPTIQQPDSHMINSFCYS
ncbi:hypothetical protein [Streptomyces bobili]|uniref:hypothetical protein n=1 Tax=Streptomyces bobili TaxID=67280 RepID=UPI00378BD6F3